MIKVIFVCMGNICRSPTGEGIFNKLLVEQGLSEQFEVDSAGTIGYHQGEPADSRMRHHAKARGYTLTSLARKFNPQKDFEKFDYILAMDRANYETLLDWDQEGKYKNKVHMMTDFGQKIQASEVPDPYYGGGDGFERVIDIVEDSCHGLLEHIKKEQNFS